jgi:transcription antitermination factor NusG
MPTAWHAVRARPGAEARRRLPASGIMAKKFRTGREIGWRPLFIGYLFVRCDPERDLARLLEIEGVAEVLRMGGRLVPIADEVIEAVRTAEAFGLFDTGVKPRFAVGEEVRLPAAFGGLVARIKSARTRRRRGMLVELVGLPFKVTAPADKLEKVAAVS